MREVLTKQLTPGDPRRKKRVRRRLHHTESRNRMKSAQHDEGLFAGIRCVFVDRDGVLNRKAPEGGYISSWDEFEIFPNVEKAIKQLNSGGQVVVVISNQRGIALGLYSAGQVDALHARFREHLALHSAYIEAFYYCPHDRNQCDCRKPGTAMFEQALA